VALRIPAAFGRVFALAAITVLCLVTLGFGAMIGRKALENRALDHCFYEPSFHGKTPRQLGAWRWWPPGYSCAKPDGLKSP
jgi:hypothetical protein